MLNPQAKGAGYSLAVVLNFTQTKMQMPKTKQSSISTFFSPQRPVLEKMESSPSTESPARAASGTKRRHDTDGEMSDSGENHRAVPQPESDDEGSLSPHQDARFRVPQEQLEEINLAGVPSLSGSQEYSFGTDMRGRSSTQKHVSSSQMDEEEKENDMLSSSYYSRQPSSHPRYLSRAVSPLKPIQDHATWEKPNMEQNIHARYSWIKASRSPLKKGARRHGGDEEEEEELAMLFTQDSDGFRVIAHRGLQARGPLKDASKAARIKPSRAYESLCEEEEELLFTQDSQGNMLIKH
ncbi:aurora kinase A and ninein-interacting protein isoform X2 [Dunckerocampus dactyliophorus]|nr:aurora kinase A and ninein-interacting protein isoform X2 [Dunckerocampus dactyliophorus]